MFHFSISGAHGKFNDIKPGGFLKKRRYRVTDINLTSPGLFVCANVNDSLSLAFRDETVSVRIDPGVYTRTNLVAEVNKKLTKEMKEDAPQFTYNLHTKLVSVKNGHKKMNPSLGQRSIMYTLGFSTEFTLEGHYERVASQQPHNLYITPTNTQQSRAQEEAFSRMELASRRGKSMFLCVSGKTRCYRLKSGEREPDELLQDDYLSSAVAVASLGLPGFPVRCLRSEYYNPPSHMKRIEISFRNEAGRAARGH